MMSDQEYFEESRAFHGSIPLIMGTRMDVLLIGAQDVVCRSLWKDMCAEVERLDSMLNRFDPLSEVSRYNSAVDNGGAPVSEELARMFGICEDYKQRTGGLFDITRGQGKAIDFGGFAKGYVLKLWQDALSERGIRDAFVDFGGSSILAMGHHPFGECWKVSVTDPFTGEQIYEAQLCDMSLSTSGNQPGYVGHIIDPRSGEKVTRHRIVAVEASNPLDAEIASTAAMIANEQEIAIIKKNCDLAKISIFG